MIIKMRISLRSSLIPLSVAGILFLTACPQMTSVPMGAPGSPMSAGGEEKTGSEKTPDSEESFAPPAAAAPVPPSGTIGAGDSAGTTPAPEPAFRSLDGVVTSDTPIPVSGPVASSDRGILPAPTSREAIDNPDDNLRIVYFPNGVTRRWTNASEFLQGMTEDQATAAKVRTLSFVICPSCAPDPELPEMVRREDEIPGGGLVTDPGYYLFFTIKDELIEQGFLFLDLGSGLPREWLPVNSLAHLKDLVEDNRLKFLGDRSILPRLLTPRAGVELRIPYPRPAVLPTGPLPTLPEGIAPR